MPRLGESLALAHIQRGQLTYLLRVNPTITPRVHTMHTHPLSQSPLSTSILHYNAHPKPFLYSRTSSMLAHSSPPSRFPTCARCPSVINHLREIHKPLVASPFLSRSPFLSFGPTVAAGHQKVAPVRDYHEIAHCAINFVIPSGCRNRFSCV